VKGTIFRMAAPMLGGTFAMCAFNLTDAWFVAKLGTLPLAAMGFSFPVLMFLGCVAMGLGMGASTIIAHALGRHDHEQASQIAGHALLLGVIVVLVVSVAGLLTIGPLFRALGADDAVMPYIRGFMTVSYLGSAFMVLPMMGNDMIRATGDTTRPSLVMIAGAALNLVLDPALIFGLCGCPRLGITGAALATALSQMVVCVLIMRILKRRGLLRLERPRWVNVRASWAQIAAIGAPNALSNFLGPISSGVITWIVAKHGQAAVGACAAASRLEMFAFMIPMTVGMSLLPITAQNFGAGRFDRIREVRRFALAFALLCGLTVAALLAVFARRIAAVFTADPAVTEALVLFLRVIPFGYGFLEVHRYNSFMLTGIKRPLDSMTLNILRIVALLVPLSFLGSALAGLPGVFAGRLVTDILSGVAGILWFRFVFLRMARKAAGLKPPTPAVSRPNADEPPA